MKKLLYLLIIPLLTMAFGNKETPCVFLAGDSTMSTKKPGDAPETGWGMAFPDFFDTTAVKFENHAVNGRSTKSFRDLGHWDKMIARVKPGDYVFLQFGHNDSKTDDPQRYAPAQTDYRANLNRFIAEIRAKGAQPVLLTPVVRRNFDDKGQFVDKHGDYPGVAREVAAAQKVPLIDLWAKSKQLLEKLGPEGSKPLFMNFPGGIYPKFPEAKIDNTHFTVFGAAMIASLVAEGVQESTLGFRSSLLKTEFSGKYAYQLPIIKVPDFKKDTFDIRNFGGVAGGIALNTLAINAAIDTCSQRGGGVVLIPAGLWLSGPIRLRSYVNLHLEKGALLQFADDLDQYPLVRTNWEGVEAFRAHSPIYGVDLEDVAITGSGVFDAAGLAWRPLKRSKVTGEFWKKRVASGGVLNESKDMWYPTERALLGASATRPGVIAEGYDEKKALEIKEFLRPNMVSLVRCNRVYMDGPTFQNSPAWTIHVLLCNHFTIKNVSVKNPDFAQNGDGIDLESTRFFRVQDCVFDTGDDGICIKSGRDEEGRKRGVPTSNGIVSGCTVFKAHGGFVIGSEMSGGVHDLYVSDCTFLGSDIGLRFKTTRGRGGTVEDIYISRINMTNVPSEAILFDMYYNGKEAAEALKNPKMTLLPVTEETPSFRRFYFQNIACRGAEHAIYIQGLPEMNVQNIQFQDCIFHATNGITCVEGTNIQFKNIQLETTSADPAIQVVNSKNLLFDNIHITGKSAAALKIDGDRSGAIRLHHTDTRSRDIQFGEGVKRQILTKD